MFDHLERFRHFVGVKLDRERLLARVEKKSQTEKCNTPADHKAALSHHC